MRTLLAAARARVGGGPPPRAPLRADRVVVHKAARRLELWRDGRRMVSHPVALGFQPVGHKRREGDGRTPEGRYRIDWRNPRSRFHLALHVSYPDDADRRRAAAVGVDPGGEIMIHGQPNGRGWLAPLRQRRDWTHGCIALTNRAMRAVWAAVPDGIPIDILP